MKKYIFVLMIFLLSFLFVACGTDDGEANENKKGEESDVNISANEEKNKENETEEQSSEDESDKGEKLPDSIPEDFPFPDEMGIVTVQSMDRSGGGKSHVIGFETTVDAEELYNEMKTYLEENGCEGEEIGDQFACNDYSGNAYLGGAKINIGDTVSTVTFIIPGKE